MSQARQLGLTIAFAVFLDTFFVRTLLVLSRAALLGRWNWWPSTLSSPPANQLPVDPSRQSDRVTSFMCECIAFIFRQVSLVFARFQRSGLA
jgi:uncharacterized membrane protein YdfJ with MMPL/SSD domain